MKEEIDKKIVDYWTVWCLKVCVLRRCLISVIEVALQIARGCYSIALVQQEKKLELSNNMRLVQGGQYMEWSSYSSFFYFVSIFQNYFCLISYNVYFLCSGGSQ